MSTPKKQTKSKAFCAVFERVEDVTADMGIIYQRSIGFSQADNTYARDFIICPRESSRVTVSIRAERKTYDVNATQILFVPRQMKIDMTCGSSLLDYSLLLPNDLLMTQLISENELSADEAKKLRAQSFKLRRSRWMDDLIERYLFERIRNRHSPLGCPFFLEKQMMNELARLIFRETLQTHGDMLGEEPAELPTRAQRYIEAHLFEDLDLRALGETLSCSASTLSRSFQTAYGVSPGTYVKDRRLDEAALLIERGEHQIGDISMLVGYKDLSAFTRAFKGRFGVPPGAWRQHAAKGMYNTGKKSG